MENIHIHCFVVVVFISSVISLKQLLLMQTLKWLVVKLSLAYFWVVSVIHTQRLLGHSQGYKY